jgi:hypothetical protein
MSVEVPESFIASVIQPEKQGRDHENQGQGKLFSQNQIICRNSADFFMP